MKSRLAARRRPRSDDLRPQRFDPARHRDATREVNRGKRCRRARLPGVSLAHRSALVAIITLPIAIILSVRADVVDARDLEHHVTRRNCDCHWRNDRFSDHHDRERAQGARTFSRRARTRAQQSRARSGDHCRGQERRPIALFCAACNHRELRASLHADCARRTTIPAAGLYKNVLDVLCVVSRRDARAGADDAAHSRENHSGRKIR